jgi:multidrug resistance protein
MSKTFQLMTAGVSPMADSTKKRGLPPILVIFLTVLIDMIGFGIVIPILPLYSEHFHALEWQTGLLLGIYSLMQLIFAPLLGRWSDRFGRRPVLVLSIFGTALGFLVLGLANSLAMLFVGRVIDGISGGNISTAQAYIADVTPPEKRSAAMGIIGAAFGLGFVVGPALGGWLGHYSMQWPFYFAAGLALLNALAVFALLPESLPEEKRSHPAIMESPWQTFLSAKNTPLGWIMACSLLGTIAFSLVTAHYTLFTNRRLGWSALDNGHMFAFIGVIGLLVQGGMLRRLVPRTGEKPLVVLGTIILFASMALLPISDNFWLIVLASAGLAVGNSLVTPMLSGLASKSVDSQSQGVVMGLLQSIASLGRMIGPILGGFLLTFDVHHTAIPFGLTAFWTSAVLVLVSVTAAVRLAPADHTVHVREA